MRIRKIPLRAAGVAEGRPAFVGTASLVATQRYGDHPTHVHGGTSASLDAAPKFPLRSVREGTSKTVAGLTLALVLLVEACAGVGNASTGSASAGGTEPLSLRIVAPSGDAQVSTPFEVQLDSSVPLGSPDTGQHHVHLYYDTTTPDGPYDLVYGNSFQVTNLPPGKHTVLASLRNANHSDAGPRDTITVTVARGGEGTAGSGTGAAVPERGYGY